MADLLIVTAPTPAGPFVGFYDPATGALAAGGFATPELIAERVPGSATIAADPHRTTDAGRAIHAAVAAYVDGELRALDAIPVDQDGGPFMRRAWEELRRIEPGETLTYTELAARAGSPRAIRAAGSACATNHVALFVPCHRIVRTDGSLGGYQWGLDVKTWLLQHEGADVETSAQGRLIP